MACYCYTEKSPQTLLIKKNTLLYLIYYFNYKGFFTTYYLFICYKE